LRWLNDQIETKPSSARVPVVQLVDFGVALLREQMEARQGLRKVHAVAVLQSKKKRAAREGSVSLVDGAL
jgi:hypothetical protein